MAAKQLPAVIIHVFLIPIISKLLNLMREVEVLISVQASHLYRFVNETQPCV